MNHRSISRILLPLLAAGLVGALGLRAGAQGGMPGGGSGAPGGGSGAPGTPPPQPAGVPPDPSRRLAGSGGRWAWLRSVSGGQELRWGQFRGSSLIGRAVGWDEVAQEADHAYVLQKDGDGGEILRASFRGNSIEPVARGLENPSGLGMGLGDLLWFERRPAPDPGLGFIPPASTLARLRLHDHNTGQVRTVLEWPAGPVYRAVAPPAVIAGSPEDVYVRVGRLTSTEFLRITAKGEVSRVAVESGQQRAVLHNGALYWTAPSEEAAPGAAMLCVRRARPGGKPETVTDWLFGDGRLLATRNAVWYVADSVYRVPKRYSEPEFARYLPPGDVVSDGTALLRLGAEETPVPLEVKGE